MELAYSFHLGNDKNKTKKARQVARNSKTGTTSFNNNAIQNSKQLGKVFNHNHRNYDDKKEGIVLLVGTDNLVEDVKNLYLKEFEEVRIKYNDKQTRSDRKIDNYFDSVSKNDKSDLACEIIVELGDMEFWSGKDKNYQRKMIEVYKEQLKNLERIVPSFKIANAICHLDENSPHLHIVGVPVKTGNKNGLEKLVGKSSIFTKDSLKGIQDKMRVACINSFNKIYESELSLKAKRKGRNNDYKVSEMDNYQKLRKEQEKNTARLKEVNLKTDKLNGKSKVVEDIITNLKPTTFKNNFLLSESEKDTIIDYIKDVNSNNKTVKSVSDLTSIMKKYGEDLIEHDSQVYELTTTIESKDKQIKSLSNELNNTKNIVVKQREKINFLEKQLSYFKNLWTRISKFFQIRIRGNSDKVYEKVADDLYNNNVISKEEKDNIKYGISINKNKSNKDYDL